MGESVVGLWLDGRTVAEYVVEPDLDAKHGPRPYLHPVRTLSGIPVTDALPEDHVWHLGASLAVQDVSGTNLWGGRTYVRDVGYTWREDHGRIAHDEWISRADDRLAHRLRWCDRDGAVLLTEKRVLSARRAGPSGATLRPAVPVAGSSARQAAAAGGPATGTGTGTGVGAGAGAGARDAWVLDISYTLTAPKHRAVTLGSPATNGRPGGAGYGGFFWRVAAGADLADAFTEREDGEERVNGSAEPWVALARPAYTLIFHGLGDGDRWFVRTRMYPGVCAAFAFEKPRMIGAGERMVGRHAVVIVDGRLDRPGVRAVLAQAGLSG